jgi:hypothetical protein
MQFKEAAEEDLKEAFVSTDTRDKVCTHCQTKVTHVWSCKHVTQVCADCWKELCAIGIEHTNKGYSGRGRDARAMEALTRWCLAH